MDPDLLWIQRLRAQEQELIARREHLQARAVTTGITMQQLQEQLNANGYELDPAPAMPISRGVTGSWAPVEEPPGWLARLLPAGRLGEGLAWLLPDIDITRPVVILVVLILFISIVILFIKFA